MTDPARPLLVLLALISLGLSTAQARDPDRDWVLALSWEPAFCETVDHRPRECQNATRDEYAARHLVLHGLWPENGSYCDVPDHLIKLDKSRKWSLLPDLSLPRGLETALRDKMPGSLSHLDRHEWFKHGTCSGLGAEGYYRLSLRLVEAAEDLETSRLIREKTGSTLTYAELCNSLRRDFGDAGHSSVRVKQRKMRGRFYLQEIRIALATGPDGILTLDPHDLRPGKVLKCDSRTLFIDLAGPQS